MDPRQLDPSTHAEKLVEDAVTDAAEQRSRRQQQDREQQEAADGVAGRRRALDDDRRGRSSTATDHERTAEIRRLMATGGDKAVAKRFGEAELNTPEAAKARTQRQAVRSHERAQVQRAASAEAARQQVRQGAARPDAGRQTRDSVRSMRDEALAKARERAEQGRETAREL